MAKSLLAQIFAFGIEPTSANTPTEKPAAQTSELIERVIQRAKEIRTEWSCSNGEPRVAADAMPTGEKIQHPAFNAQYFDQQQQKVYTSKVEHEAVPSDLLTRHGMLPKATDFNFAIAEEKQESEFVRAVAGSHISRRGPSVLTAEISSESIRAAIYSALPESGRVEREMLVRECAQILGFTRVSQNLRSRLNKTIGAEARYGRIQRDATWQYLWRKAAHVDLPSVN
jgi:hypothetical protein